MDTGICIEGSEIDPEFFAVTVADEELTSKFRIFIDGGTLRNIADLVQRFDSVTAMSSAEFTLGSFGPATAGGALEVKLLSQGIDKVHLTLHAQHEYFVFGAERVAKELRLHLITEPAQLDRFAIELRSMAGGSAHYAMLAAQTP